MRALVGAWRFALALLHIGHGLWLCAVRFPRWNAAERLACVQWWSARMLRWTGIAVELHGEPAAAPVLVAANHISWIDMLALHAVRPVRFVSKADVRRWPVLGWLIACGGTLFIERERKRDALRVVHAIADALAAGDVIALFPEGTTTDGRTLLPFHANLLQAAIATGVAVQPVALHFSDEEDAFSRRAAFVGDMTLAASIWSVLCGRSMRAHVHLLPPIDPAGLDRRALADAVRRSIATVLGLR